MKKMMMTVGVLIFAVALTVGCGGGSSSTTTDDGSGESGGTTTGAGEAAVTSLAAIPTIDLSSYDKSTSTSTASIVVPTSKSIGLKSMGENLNAVGKSSRAGCEANMHKKEMIRMSQTSQLERCYPEAMESIGLIEIPADSYNYYLIQPPEEGETEKSNKCAGIPAEDTVKKAECESGGGKGGGKMWMRLGRFNTELQIDMCEGEAGSASLVNESTYTASGSLYTATVIHINNWMGELEKHRLEISVELGADGTVTDGIVDLGTAGTASATGNMSGNYGDGLMHFEAIGSDSSNRVYGAFAGSFVDPFTSTESSFTGKVYSRFGGSSKTGCAKYSFGGSMPPMRVSDMVPFDIAQGDLDEFLKSFGNELGIQLNSTNYQTIMLCENPNFDFKNPDNTVKPMLALESGSTCPMVTHNDIECFSITNLTQNGTYGTKVVQSFTIISPSGSTYYDEVNAYNIDDLSATITTPAYGRNWDCTGEFSTVDFMSVSQETAMAAMQKCFLLEEKAFDNQGMGEYNCGEQQQMNGVDDFAEGGGGGMGIFGGELGFKEDGGNTCTNNPAIGRLFVDAIDPEAGRYCVAFNGGCHPFVVTGTTGAPEVTIDLDGSTVTQLTYNDADNPTGCVVSYTQNGSPCQQAYLLEKHTFGPPPEFGAEGGGDQPGEEGFIPAPCIDAVTGQPVAEQVCMQICSDPANNCFQ